MSVLELPPQGALGAALATSQAAARLAAFDVTALSGSEAVELLSVVGPVLAQLESVSVAAAHVVRESGVWGLDGSRSAKAYLERTTGASGAKVASDLKLSECLTSVLPLTAEALRGGRISGDH